MVIPVPNKEPNIILSLLFHIIDVFIFYFRVVFIAGASTHCVFIVQMILLLLIVMVSIYLIHRKQIM